VQIFAKCGPVQGFRTADGRFRVVYDDNSEYWESLSESTHGRH